MAAPSLRLVRRQKGASALTAAVPPRALTAASAIVEDPTQIFKTGAVGRSRVWQDEAWELYRRVGELGFLVRWRARSCSRVRLVASEIDPNSGEPTGSITEDNAEGLRFAEIVRQIAGGPLGQAQLIKRAVEILSVPGELWVVVLVRPEGERWFPVTREEIRASSRGRGGVTIDLPDGSVHEFSPGAGDGMFRVWNPDARKASEPDSPVRSNFDPLREIVQATKKIRNADLSRLIGNGILMIPQEASLPGVVAPVAADKPGGAAAAAGVGGSRVAESLQALIVRQATIAAEEGETSMAALVPLVGAAPGDYIDKIKHIQFADQVTPVAIQTRNDAIARLAMGLDMSPEQLLGLGSTNHWSSWQLADEDVQLHVSPVMEVICQALYDSVLRGMLVAEGIDPARYTLWYDTSKLTVDPDKTDEARDAFDRGQITGEALVALLGLPVSALHDLTTVDGLKVWARDVVQRDPAQLPMLAGLLDAPAGVEFPSGPPVALPPGDEDSGAGRQEEPDTEDDAGVAVAAVGGGEPVSMAVDLMVTRALELAGKRRRTRADMERLRAVPVQETHRYMGPVADGDVAPLIKGWDVGLDEIARRYGLDADQIRVVVGREARRRLTTQVVDA